MKMMKNYQFFKRETKHLGVGSLNLKILVSKNSLTKTVIEKYPTIQLNIKMHKCRVFVRSVPERTEH